MIRLGALRDMSKLLAGSVLARVFGLASLMLFARVLPKNEMAVFPAFLMLAGFFNLLSDPGTSGTIVRMFPGMQRDDPARACSMIRTSSTLVLAAALVIAAAMAVASGMIAGFVFDDPNKAWIIRLMIPGCLAFVCARIADTLLWASGRFGRTSLIQIFDSVIRPPATIVLYYLMGVKGIVIGLVAAQICVAMASLFAVRDLLTGPSAGVYSVRQLISESLPYYLGNFIAYLRGDGDSLLVTTMVGPAALAEYFIAKNLYVNLMLVLTAMDRVAVQRLAQFSSASEPFLQKVKEFHVHISQLVVPAILFVIALAPYAVTVLAGSRYSGTKWPAVALLVVALAQFMFTPVQRAVYVGLPGIYRTISGAVETAIVLGVAFLLVPHIAIIGAAIARLLGPIAGSLIGIVVLYRMFGLVLSFRPFLLSLAAALPATVAILILAPPAHALGPALAYAAVASIVWTSSFVILTLLINRPLFHRAQALVAQRLRFTSPA